MPAPNLSMHKRYSFSPDEEFKEMLSPLLTQCARLNINISVLNIPVPIWSFFPVYPPLSWESVTLDIAACLWGSVCLVWCYS